MRILETAIPGTLIIEPAVFGDERGFFMETWNEAAFAQAGLTMRWAQDNHSRSQKGVLRGLHFQHPQAQGKLVRVARGAVFDVAVDLRRGSAHFGQWVGAEISDQNGRMVWIPEGFAHGFLTLSDEADLLYKCTALYAPQHEHTLAWDDPAVGIEWPVDGLDLIISDKDKVGLELAQVPSFD